MKAMIFRLLASLLLICLMVVLYSRTKVGNIKEEELVLEQAASISIDFPLEGEWITPNTPGSKIPSHGTTEFGESHAIDFVMVNTRANKNKPYRKRFAEYLFFGLPLEDFYGWGQDVHCAVEGEVVSVENSVVERNPVSVLHDLIYMVRETRKFKIGKGTVQSIAGNYVLMKCCDGVYALYAHLKTGSVVVEPGQKVSRGQVIGKLGHSGNSTMPHLHFQLMDSPEFHEAHGLPFRIREYQVLEKGVWKTVQNSVPTDKETIRFMILEEHL